MGVWQVVELILFGVVVCIALAKQGSVRSAPQNKLDVPTIEAMLDKFVSSLPDRDDRADRETIPDPTNDSSPISTGSLNEPVLTTLSPSHSMGKESVLVGTRSTNEPSLQPSTNSDTTKPPNTEINSTTTKKAVPNPVSRRLGVTISPAVGNSQNGMTVVTVEPFSPATRLRCQRCQKLITLEAGQVVTHINGTRIQNYQQFLAAIEKPGPVCLQVVCGTHVGAFTVDRWQ
jgi:hypothetical protein